MDRRRGEGDIVTVQSTKTKEPGRRDQWRVCICICKVVMVNTLTANPSDW
jgi:hypothetical protein